MKSLVLLVTAVVTARKTLSRGLQSWYGRSYSMDVVTESMPSYSIDGGMDVESMSSVDNAWQAESIDGCVVNTASTGNVPRRGKAYLPKGAPKSWDKMCGTARVALERANACRALRVIDDVAETDVTEQPTDVDSDESDVDDSFDFDGMVRSETYWERLGVALDPYWSTCPVVIEDQGYTNSLVRWCEYDGEHPTPQVEHDSLAESRIELEALRKAYKTGQLDNRTLQFGIGLKTLTELAAETRCKSVEGMFADASAYMRFGAQSRQDRFWRLVELFQRGETALEAGRAGIGFLSWLSKCWSVDVESRYADGCDKRRKHGNNKMLACGSDYWLTFGQVNHLRARRKSILRRYSAVSGLTFESGKRFMSAYARKVWGFGRVSGNGCGSRGALDFGPNPVARDMVAYRKPRAMAHHSGFVSHGRTLRIGRKVQKVNASKPTFKAIVERIVKRGR